MSFEIDFRALRGGIPISTVAALAGLELTAVSRFERGQARLTLGRQRIILGVLLQLRETRAILPYVDLGRPNTIHQAFADAAVIARFYAEQN